MPSVRGTSVTVKSTLVSRWLPKTEIDLDVAVLEMATDIHRRAAMLAPKDTRALVNSGRVKRLGKGKYDIIFGGGRVPYARFREYVNRKNPSTIGYLSRAGDGIVRGNIKKYFR